MNVVVVIEDTPEVGDLIQLVLEQAGVRVVRADDGEAGLAAIQAERPAAVVCDVLLPRLSGFEVCRQVKADPDLAGIRVVLLSAVYRTSRYARDAEEAGADLFLPKPVEAERLLRALEPALGPAEPQGEPTDFASELAEARERYRAKVPERLARAEALLDELGTGSWDPERAAELRMLFHGLSGAGSTMGLTRLGELARELEEVIDRRLERGRSPDADDRRRLRRTLAVMREAFGGSGGASASD